MGVLPAIFVPLIVLQVVFVPTAETANILFLSFSSSRSHQLVYEPLLLELAGRGHIVTLVSPVPASRTHQNLRQIITPNIESHLDHHAQAVFARQQSPSKSLLAVPTPFLSGEKYTSICRAAYADARVLALKDEQFDLVFLKNFLNECTYGLAHVLNTTTILTTTFPAFRWNAETFGAFYPPSFVPSLLVTYSDRMSFFQRVVNFVAEIVNYAMRQFLFVPKMEAVYRDVLGQQIPSVSEIESNASLLFMNSDFTLTYPRPQMPDMIEIAGLHCVDPKPLPDDIESFIAGAGKNGFLYVSFGSILKSHMMPATHVEAFLTAFAKLKEHVIWKWELNDSSIVVPRNVKLVAWLPQQDILGHAAIRAFITHGGLLSTEEAVYHGVPIIGIPMFGDQHWNVRQAEEKGFGIQLEFHETADTDKISSSIQNVLQQRYSDQAKKMSRIFRDKISKPMDRAIFWTEYVLRHKGAMHMRSAGRHLNFWQYHSLDVVVALLIGLVTSLALIVLLFKRVINFFASGLLRVSRRSTVAKHKLS